MDILETIPGIVLLLLGMALLAYIPSQLEKLGMYEISHLPSQVALTLVYSTSTPGNIEINLSSKLTSYSEFRIRLASESYSNIKDFFEDKSSYVAYGGCIPHDLLAEIGGAIASAVFLTVSPLRVKGIKDIIKAPVIEGIGTGIIEVTTDAVADRNYLINLAKYTSRYISNYAQTIAGYAASAFVRYIFAKLIIAATGGVGVLILFATNLMAELLEIIEIIFNPGKTCINFSSDSNTYYEFFPIEELYISHNTYFKVDIEGFNPFKIENEIYKQGIPEGINVLKFVINKEEEFEEDHFGIIRIKANLAKE